MWFKIIPSIIIGLIVLEIVGLACWWWKSQKEKRETLFVSQKPTFVPTPTPVPISLEGVDKMEPIVGNFQKWEKIQDSEDRYFVLVNTEGGELFPKVRVGFEFGELWNQEGFQFKYVTGLGVKRNENEYEALGDFRDFTDEELDKLFKKGDPVKIFLRMGPKESKSLKDENGFTLAYWVFIQKEEGKTAVEKILGRKIEKP